MPFLFTARSRARNTVLPIDARIALAALAAVLTLFNATVAAEAPLSLVEAQRMAVAHSRQLTAQDHSVSASREMAVAAGQLPDPMLNVGVDNLPVDGPDRFSVTRDFMTMRRVGVSQEFTRAEKRRLRSKKFEREAEKALAEKGMTTAAVERDTALAWLDRYYAEAMAAVIAEQGAQAKLEIQAADAAYRAGRGSQADVFAARSALGSLDDRASEAERRVRNASAMLARWIGDAANRPLAGQPVIDTIHMDPAMLETQLAHHPQIAVMTRQEEIAQVEAKLAQANKKSDWSVQLMLQQRGPAFSNMISVGVSIPLQWDQKNRQDRELSAKLAMVEQARAERDEALRERVAEALTMINEWQNNRERRARYGRELIPLSMERTLAALTAYRGGKSSLADVLAARRDQIDVRQQALQLEADTARLWAQLNFLFPTTNMASQATMPANRDTK
ncbi:MAG: TolC family protein [Sulfuritalea sp.]|nr:TolC family protein [Sulfuritalea sp.]